MKRLLAITLLLAWIAPVGASEPAVPAEPLRVQDARTQPLTACTADMLLAQVSQNDCCKGHKGVCGCRAGKIVCCDNTTSLSCTCHADSGIEN